MLETLDEFTTFLRTNGLDSSTASSAPAQKRVEDNATAPEQHPVVWMLIAARAACELGASRIDLTNVKGIFTFDIRGVQQIDELYARFAGAWTARDYGAHGVGLLVQVVECLLALTQDGLSLSFVNEANQIHVLEISPGLTPLTAPAGPLLRIAWKAAASYPLAKAVSTFQERLRFSPLAIFQGTTQLNQPILHQCAHFSREVKENNQPSLRRNFLERICLPDTPLKDQFMISDPFATSAHSFVWNGQLFAGAPGTTNVREFCQAPGLDYLGAKGGGGLLGGGVSLAWRRYPPCYWNVYDTPGTGLAALFGSRQSHKATAVGAVLRLGRHHRGTGLLFPIHQGVLLDPVDLGPDFSGCWAFVAAPSVTPTPSQGQAEADRARQLLVDWTKSQFVHMGETLKTLLGGRDSERLGLGFEFQKELRRARESFQAWDERQWGDPSKDF